jgi:hypothetical protein
MRSAWWLIGLLAVASPCADFAAGDENPVHKTQPGKQLAKEDAPCGSYFWKSEKAKPGSVVVYYFYGSTEWGKGKMGMYPIKDFRVTVSPEKDPPTAQVVSDRNGNFQEVRVRMTDEELQKSRSCFPAQ